MPKQCFIHVKDQFREKKSGSSIKNFPSLELPRNTITTPYYSISSLLSVEWSLTDGLKQKKIQTFSSSLKVVTAAYEKWSLTKGSKYGDLTWKLFVFWKTAR